MDHLAACQRKMRKWGAAPQRCLLTSIACEIYVLLEGRESMKWLLLQRQGGTVCTHHGLRCQAVLSRRQLPCCPQNFPACCAQPATAGRRPRLPHSGTAPSAAATVGRQHMHFCVPSPSCTIVSSSLNHNNLRGVPSRVWQMVEICQPHWVDQARTILFS